jgi:type VI protein secretion system component VasF
MSVDEQGIGTEQNGLDVSAVENELRQSLQHVPAPDGFADRVMARVAEREAARTSRPASARQSTSGFSGMHRNTGWWTAIAAMLLLAVGGDITYLRHQRTEREAAKVQKQMDLAMELTSHALDKVDVGLERSHAARYTQMVYEFGK